MQTPSEKLHRLGLELPTPPKPVAAYIPAKRTGNLLAIAGQIPIEDGVIRCEGTVPTDVDPALATACARLCVLNGLACANAALTNGIDDIRQVVRVGCWVASEPGFGGQPAIANGASDLLVEIFGEAGRHVRAAVGSASLPLNVPVEIEFLFEVV